MTSVFKNSEELKRWSGLRKLYRQIETRQHRYIHIDRWVVGFVHMSAEVQIEKTSVNHSTRYSNRFVSWNTNIFHFNYHCWESRQKKFTNIIRHCEKRDYGDKWKLQDDGSNSGPERHSVSRQSITTVYYKKFEREWSDREWMCACMREREREG